MGTFPQSEQVLLSPGKSPGGRHGPNGSCGHRLQYKMSTEASVVLDRRSWRGSVEPVQSFLTSPMMKVLLIRYRPQGYPQLEHSAPVPSRNVVRPGPPATSGRSREDAAGVGCWLLPHTQTLSVAHPRS